MLSVLNVKSQETNANLNSTYRVINSQHFDENKKDWVKSNDSVSNITFSIVDSNILLDKTPYKIISVKKKRNKKAKSMEYYFVLQNENLDFIDAQFYQHWYDDKRYVPQFIIKDKAYDLK